jgi:hypothetical protein
VVHLRRRSIAFGGGQVPLSRDYVAARRCVNAILRAVLAKGGTTVANVAAGVVVDLISAAGQEEIAGLLVAVRGKLILV